VPGYQRRGQHGLIAELVRERAQKCVVGEIAVAGQAVDPVQFQFDGEGGGAHQVAQLAGAHLLHVHEAHVLADAMGHLFDQVV
jgi:hypothetical protein